MDSKRVVFNVCGTKYETNTSVIESKPDTTLAMLLRNRDLSSLQSGEIFIQSDPQIFRWILYWYTTDILVNEGTVGVPKEVWDREIEYYSLFSREEKEEEEKEEEKKRKIPPIDEDHELASLAKKRIEAINARDEAAELARKEIYKALVEYMMRYMNMSKDIQTGFAFIGKGPNHKPIDWPWDYPDNLKDINFDNIDEHFEEFVQYCKQIGFKLEKIHYDKSHKGKPKYSVTQGHVKTVHQAMTLGISLIKNTGAP